MSHRARRSGALDGFVGPRAAARRPGQREDATGARNLVRKRMRDMRTEGILVPGSGAIGWSNS